MANLAVRRVADWCSVAIGDESGTYSNLVVAHRDPTRIQWAEEYNRLHPPRFDTPTGVPQVLRTGRSEFYPEFTREMLLASASSEEELRVIDELNIRSVMIVPMIARGRTLGAITFISSESGYRYNDDDLLLAEGIASRSAIAIDNARLYEEAQAARADAEAANRAKMDFLAAMSHELRTPINAIAGYSQLLAMGVHGPVTDAQQDALQRLERSHRHLLKLVEEVLVFARVEAGRLEFEYHDEVVNDILLATGELVAPQARAKHIRYEYTACDPSLIIRTDRARLEQIVVNLLANAVKFTDDGGTVTLSVQDDSDDVRIIVTDTGMGIPADRIARIFEPFVQLQQPREKRASGVGLGLAISRDLARAIGGEILVESVVGKGSAFTIRLPRGGPVAVPAGS